jgi:hypothetical protein
MEKKSRIPSLYFNSNMVGGHISVLLCRADPTIDFKLSLLIFFIYPWHTKRYILYEKISQNVNEFYKSFKN